MIINKIRQAFCNHSFKEVRKRVPFYAKNGDLVYLECTKCRKIKNKEWQPRE
ncbi:hypothetical protein KCL53_002423 [Clostridium perfringens]|uniref:hypothetical protein n=1 Tax=Clostridium perfringens TaxID=1502 RepID=UPI001C86E31C|nr:hypothetical protein [Clostridium perfringens]EHK2349277.1 hypothetical protein [Clostridium perfringens]EHK2365706.1 hypothetical protein [Clostridium perfringens]EIF6153726.1 hypothetical protein [Clostridium perfringens]MDU1966408.1 hypothetical protein [Clostridium perfringens]